MTERRDLLGLIGLGQRAGAVVIGTGGVRGALKRDELALVVVAADRSRRTEQKVLSLVRARGVPLVEGPTAELLGRSVGRGKVQIVGVRDKSLAAGLSACAPGDGLRR